MTLYLHIGLHKTGTSSLQNFLSRNAEALAAQGYVWPRAGLVGGAHHNIGYELLGKGRFSPEAGGLHALLAELDGANNAIVSSEELEFLELAEVRTLRERLGERTVRVIVYLRRQDELIASTYYQQVRMGANMGTFQEYALRSFYHPRFDFSQLAARWAHVFGRENMDVRFFPRSHSGEALIEDFLARVGLADAPGVWKPNPRRLNVSPSAAEIELLRRVIRLARKARLPTTSEALNSVQKCVSRRVAEDATLGTAMLTLDREMALRARGRFVAGNRKVVKDHGLSGPQGGWLEFTDPVAPEPVSLPLRRLREIAEDIAGELRASVASHAG